MNYDHLIGLSIFDPAVPSTMPYTWLVIDPTTQIVTDIRDGDMDNSDYDLADIVDGRVVVSDNACQFLIER